MLKKPVIKESMHQCSLIQWFDIAYPALSPLLWHTPNGGKRNAREALYLKRQGVRAGIPDLFLAVPRGTFNGLFIELKAEKGSLSENQKKYLNLLAAQGYRAECCHGWLHARDVVEEYLSHGK